MPGPCYPNFVPYTRDEPGVPTVTEEQLLLLSSANTGNTSTGDITHAASMSGDSDKIQEYLEDLLKAWMVILAASSRLVFRPCG